MTLDDLLDRTGAHVAVGKVILFTPEKVHLVLAYRVEGDGFELTEDGAALVSELAPRPRPRATKAKEAKISDLLE